MAEQHIIILQALHLWCFYCIVFLHIFDPTMQHHVTDNLV